ncbi:acetyltransferase [Phenylobacterium sp. Root77]|uniref:GNAT family N-acetyltransferase n=1 Tax=unclassified Phenylobacterium TaxID=2640670 RepID=UPI0006F7B405|nr:MULTISPECIES: GNAT family N-acetyltransferase [unclassified Phenylobacterium]KQW73427.1 acetyltransferase [Phenylobacterium sp. Root1277]KQW92646.1 acetyltransferase [Phenylobacterium sp. Root1290]KRC40873.1 acetyltransferase [Phenylobacterium sp. Root77]
MSIQIRRLNADETLRAAPALGEILKDCVDGGASVSFMADLTLEQATAFWEQAAAAQIADGRAVVVAQDDDGPVGVVQVIPAGTPNQPHRGDVAKMLVHRRARRRGAAQALLAAAEDAARDLGLSLLVLDTVTGGDAERLYVRLGWERVGVIPNYALTPDGELCSTTYFYKPI